MNSELSCKAREKEIEMKTEVEVGENIKIALKEIG
jgi:hypothetical protein